MISIKFSSVSKLCNRKTNSYFQFKKHKMIRRSKYVKGSAKEARHNFINKIVIITRNGDLNKYKHTINKNFNLKNKKKI